MVRVPICGPYKITSLPFIRIRMAVLLNIFIRFKIYVAFFVLVKVFKYEIRKIVVIK